jgi:predicted DNA-binding antitoxin AbrB/MazE fold protein
MSITIQATYENGILRPTQALPLQENQKVQVTIETLEDRVRLVRKMAGIIPCSDPELIERIALDPDLAYRPTEEP